MCYKLLPFGIIVVLIGAGKWKAADTYFGVFLCGLVGFMALMLNEHEHWAWGMVCLGVAIWAMKRTAESSVRQGSSGWRPGLLKGVLHSVVEALKRPW